MTTTISRLAKFLTANLFAILLSLQAYGQSLAYKNTTSITDEDSLIYYLSEELSVFTDPKCLIKVMQNRYLHADIALGGVVTELELYPPYKDASGKWNLAGEFRTDKMRHHIVGYPISCIYKKRPVLQ